MKKKDKQPTLFFNELVSLYFNFFEENFGLRPSFDGSAPRDLKTIIEAMKKKSEEKNVEWNLELAKNMLETFLKFCLKDPWLKDNFLLQNLNRQKDKIFIKIKNQINGTSKEGFTREGLAAEFNRRYEERRQL